MFRNLLSLLSRFAAIGDKSALVLIVPAVVGLFWIDPAMIKTLLQWTLFAPALAGIAIIVSRVVFPQIDLGELLTSVKGGCRASATVVGALVVFVGIIFFALILWAKA